MCGQCGGVEVQSVLSTAGVSTTTEREESGATRKDPGVKFEV